MTLIYTRHLCAALSGLLLSGIASAHGIWFALRAGEFAMIYGHGAEDLDLIKRQQKITSIRGFNAQMQPVTVNLKPTGPLMFVDLANNPTVVTATMDNGTWTQGSDNKWVAKTKDEVPGYKDSGSYLKYAIYLRDIPAGAMKPLPELAAQIIPVSEKFPSQRGQTLRVQVLAKGKPAVGAKLWEDYVNDPDQKPKIAGKDGFVTVTVRNQGLNVLKAEINTAPEDAKKTNKTEHLVTLSFMLKHIPE
jgi:nickel transport protein